MPLLLLLVIRSDCSKGCTSKIFKFSEFSGQESSWKLNACGYLRLNSRKPVKLLLCRKIYRPEISRKFDAYFCDYFWQLLSMSPLIDLNQAKRLHELFILILNLNQCSEIFWFFLWIFSLLIIFKFSKLR